VQGGSAHNRWRAYAQSEAYYSNALRNFPGLLQNADGFAAEIKKLKIGYYEMKPGDIISFHGRQLVRRE
jgi:hypothetical protein